MHAGNIIGGNLIFSCNAKSPTDRSHISKSALSDECKSRRTGPTGLNSAASVCALKKLRSV